MGSRGDQGVGSGEDALSREGCPLQEVRPRWVAVVALSSSHSRY